MQYESAYQVGLCVSSTKSYQFRDKLKSRLKIYGKNTVGFGAGVIV